MECGKEGAFVGSSLGRNWLITAGTGESRTRAIKKWLIAVHVQYSPRRMRLDGNAPPAQTREGSGQEWAELGSALHP